MCVSGEYATGSGNFLLADNFDIVEYGKFVQVTFAKPFPSGANVVVVPTFCTFDGPDWAKQGSRD